MRDNFETVHDIDPAAWGIPLAIHVDNLREQMLRVLADPTFAVDLAAAKEATRD